jgi:hypothetical protein
VGDVQLVHDAGYTGDAVAGYRAAIVFVVLGGLPLAFAAVGVLLATWRRAPRPWPPAAAVLFRLAFVIEGAACLCSALFLALVAPAAPSAGEFFGEPIVWLMIATMFGGAVALPAWRAAMLASSPDPPPSVVTGRRE